MLDRLGIDVCTGTLGADTGGRVEKPCGEAIGWTVGVSVTTLGSETGGEGNGSTGGGIGIVLFKMVATCRIAVRVSSLIGRSGDDVLGALRIDRMSETELRR